MAKDAHLKKDLIDNPLLWTYWKHQWETVLCIRNESFAGIFYILKFSGQIWFTKTQLSNCQEHNHSINRAVYEMLPQICHSVHKDAPPSHRLAQNHWSLFPSFASRPSLETRREEQQVRPQSKLPAGRELLFRHHPLTVHTVSLPELRTRAKLAAPAEHTSRWAEWLSFVCVYLCSLLPVTLVLPIFYKNEWKMKKIKNLKGPMLVVSSQGLRNVI